MEFLMQLLLPALVDCVQDGLEAPGDMEFPEDAVQMGLDRLLAYEEFIANFFVRAPGG